MTTSYLKLPVQGGITTASSSTRYSNFNIKIARSSPTLIDFFSCPYNGTISSIDLIIIPSGTAFAWPTFGAGQYFAFRMGYETAGAFTQFAPTTNPHFTVGNATVPIAGVTHFNRSGLFNVVRYVPTSTWTVAPGTNITLQQVSVGAVSPVFILVMIYVQGSTL